MATQDSTNPALEPEKLAMLQDGDRIALCLSATYELDKIARMLPGLIPLDDDQNHFAVKALAGRMLRLTNVLLSGLDDEAVPNDDLRQIVHFDECSGQG